MKQELMEILDECKGQLNDIETRINALPALDKGRQYFTNYALIKACGTAELVYRSIVADYFAKLSDVRINTYLDKTIRKGSMSPTYEKMQELLKKFDEQWQKNFQHAVDQRADKEKLIKATQSLVNNRHSFAHGNTPTATFLDIKQYYSDIVTLIGIFDSIVC